MCTKSVSYTHLDVYKRQVQSGSKVVTNNLGLKIYSSEDKPVAKTIRSVSYTHLDVYKRQARIIAFKL